MDQIIVLPGVVRGLGHDASAAAAFYANLTGRPYQLHVSVDDLETNSHDVVVCSTAQLTVALIHKLFVTGDARGAPGLICAPNAADLMEVCRQQALRFIRRQHTPPKRVFLYPTLDFESTEKDTDVILSGLASERVLPAVSSGASVLSIFGHSDGIDLSLSARHFACPFLGNPAPDKDFGAPCQSLGKCVKFPTMPSIAEAEQKGWIVPLSGLRADVGVIFGCYVLKVADGTIDPAHGLAAALLRQSDFGVLITTWRKEFYGGWNHLAGLVNDICSGTMVGLAVRAFNRSAAALQYGVNLCVVGDPCFTLEPNSAFTTLPTVESDAVANEYSPKSNGASDSCEITLLRDAARAAPQVSRLLDKTKADAVLSALSSCTTEAGGPAQARLIRQSEEALLELLRTSPWLDKFFGRFCKLQEVNEHEVCPACLGPARSFWMAFPQQKAKPRKILRCSSCDDISSLPLGWNIEVDVTRLPMGEVSLTGVPRGAQLLVSLTSFWGSLYDSFRLPDADGESLLVRLPKDLPAMPIYAWILIAHRFEIGSIGFRLRKLTSGRYSTALFDLNKAHNSAFV